MPEIGHTISHCRLVEIIGGAGMDIICKAEDTKLQCHVALKYLPEEVSKNPQALESFRLEAQAASFLNHPSICTHPYQWLHPLKSTRKAYFVALPFWHFPGSCPVLTRLSAANDPYGCSGRIK